MSKRAADGSWVDAADGCVGRCGRYVGRVGALAVALGVGAAFVAGSSAGVARADESGAQSSAGTSETTRSSESAASTAGAGSVSGAQSAEGSQGGVSASGSSSEGDEGDDAGSEVVVDLGDEPSVRDGEVESGGRDGEVVDDGEVEDAESVVEDSEVSEVLAVSAGEEDGGRGSVSVVADSEPVEVEDVAADEHEVVAPVLVDDLVLAVPDEAVIDTASAVAVVTGQDGTSGAEAVQLAEPQADSGVDAVVKVASSVLSPWDVSGTDGVPSSPLLAVLLAWGRREGQRSLGSSSGEDEFQVAAMAAAAVVNTAPTAVNDGPFAVVSGGSVTLSYGQLLGNDVDPDVASGDVLSVNSVYAAQGSVVNNTATKTVTYTPVAGYTGPASFIYRVRDAAGAVSANTATVSITVTAPPNTAPTAVNDGPFTVVSGGSLTLTYGQLLGNDVDPDVATGDVLSVNSVYASSGTVVNNTATKTVTYTPVAGYTGPASFIYRVKDATGAVSANTATVTLSVVAPNTAPTAVNDGPFTVAKDGSITLTYAQLLGNDIDPDTATGDVLSVNSVYASYGTVVNNTATKTVSYTPVAGYTGPASFIYRVKDATGAVSANTATVTLSVSQLNAGFPNGGVLAAADGTLYQVMVTDFDPNAGMPGSTRVGVLSPSGDFLAISDAIPGVGYGIVRSDGTLLLLSNEVDLATYQVTSRISAVDSAGTTISLAVVDGAAFTLGPGTYTDPYGTVYFVSSSVFAVTASNEVRTYELDGTALSSSMAPDGTLYVQQYGYELGGQQPTLQSSILGIKPDGTSFSAPSITGQGGTVLSMLVASDGKAHHGMLSFDTTTSSYETVIQTVDGSAVTTQILAGRADSQLVAGPNGSVYVSITDSQGLHIARLTGATTALSSGTLAYPQNWPHVAGDGTAYLLSTGQSSGSQVLVFSADNTTSIASLEGYEFVELPGGSPTPLPLITVGPDNKAYIPIYNGTDAAIAVVNSSGLENIVPLSGLPSGPVAFGVDGTPYQTLATMDDTTGGGTTSVLALTTGVYTSELAGFAGPTTADFSDFAPPVLAFGPDGTGYLLVVGEDNNIHGLLFEPDGDTIATFTDQGIVAGTEVITRLGPFTGIRSLRSIEFGDDGTAYVVIYSDANGAEGTLSVWAMNNSGASKIAEFASDPFPSIFSPGGPATGVNWPTLGFGPDDAVYLTTSSLDAQTGEYTTTVHLISGPSPL